MAEMPRLFTASAEVQLACPQQIMLRLCAHFREFGEVTIEGASGRIDTGFGIAGMEACERCLKISAEGKDEVALAYVKLAVAEHLLRFAIDECPQLVWAGDGSAGAPLPYFREMRVVRVSDVTPHMRRLTLKGENLHRFATGGLHVRLLFPKNRRTQPQWPVTGADGRPSWPTAENCPDVRIYTIRRVNVAKGEVDIDFVVHPGEAMPGARFALEAEPGHVVGMTGPGGGSVGAANWYLLAGDETALPAIGRILETLPASAHAVVRIETGELADQQQLPSSASVDLQWLNRAGAAPGTTSLLADAVRRVDWPRDGRSVFAWAGCEYAAFSAIRRYLREERRLSRKEHLVAAYWRRGIAGDDARQEKS